MNPDDDRADDILIFPSESPDPTAEHAPSKQNSNEHTAHERTSVPRASDHGSSPPTQTRPAKFVFVAIPAAPEDLPLHDRAMVRAKRQRMKYGPPEPLVNRVTHLAAVARRRVRIRGRRALFVTRRAAEQLRSRLAPIRRPPVKGRASAAPKLHLPKIPRPHIHLPSLHIPTMHLRPIRFSGVHAPRIVLPKVHLPKISLPKIDFSKAGLPALLRGVRGLDRFRPRTVYAIAAAEIAVLLVVIAGPMRHSFRASRAVRPPQKVMAKASTVLNATPSRVTGHTPAVASLGTAAQDAGAGTSPASPRLRATSGSVEVPSIEASADKRPVAPIVAAHPTRAQERTSQEAVERSAFVGTLVVKSEPAGASVSINGVMRGRTPLTIGGLAAGSRVLRLDLQGYEPWSWSVSVVANRRTPVAVRLQREISPRGSRAGTTGPPGAF